MSREIRTSMWREQLAADHQQLRSRIEDVVRAFAQRRAAVEESARMLGAVNEQIEQHFQQEEQTGGFYDEIVELCPRLQHRAHQVRAQHEAFRTTAHKLAAAVRGAGDDESKWERLEEEFRQFSADLGRHESDEIELLQDAYEEDIGAKD